MSHTTQMEMYVTDLEALATACSALGVELAVGQKTFLQYGGRREQCDHAIKIPGDSRAYEIGVIRRRDGKPGYQLQHDEFAGGYGMVAKVGERGDLLARQYTTQVTTKQLRKEGYRIEERMSTDGRRVLVHAYKR